MIDRPARLVIARHIESLRNRIKGGNIYFPDDEVRSSSNIRGIPDHNIGVTEKGLEQARITSPILRERFGIFDYAYHSGYARTELTLEGLLSSYAKEERAQIKIRQNIFIRERHAGYAYDMTTEEAEKAFPWLKEYWKTHGGFFAEPPGGESLAKMVERVYLFLNMIFRDRAGKNILVVTHGGTLRCLRYILERWSYEQAVSWPVGQSPKNCGLTVYEYDYTEKRLVLKEYNTICY